MVFLSCRTISLFTFSLLYCVQVINGVSANCGLCEKSRCPELHYCDGKIVHDRCGCCSVCSSASPKNQPHSLLNADENIGDEDQKGNACAKVKCPKFKVCMENMQGLPLCTCPGPLICKQRRSRQKSVCGTDGITYESRCYLRIAACNSAKRIKVARRGPCTGAEVSRSRACDSAKSCRRRKNQNPVCGTDGKTHPSRCHMKITACQRGVKIKLKHHGQCVVSPSPGRGSLKDQRIPSTTAPDADVSKGRKERRRRKKKGGSDVSGNDEGKRKQRRKQRRDKRKKRLQRRRKRRKTRGHSRQRRYKVDRRNVRRNIGPSNWK